MTDTAALARLTDEIVACRLCPRLVEWRERVAREKVARFRDEDYWGRPVPGFGDPEARILLLGLAPAAHGGNRTGRVFTGDVSGDFLWPALHRAVSLTGVSRRADDGLTLADVYIAAAVRCAPPANKPTRRARHLCTVPRPGAGAVIGRAGHPGAWPVRLGRGPSCARGSRVRGTSQATVRTRRGDRGRSVRPAGQLSPEPAEHVHRAIDGADVRHRRRARYRRGLGIGRNVDTRGRERAPASVGGMTFHDEQGPPATRSNQERRMSDQDSITDLRHRVELWN